MELWDEYPDKYAKIITDEKLLRRPCYQIDVNNPDQVAMAKHVISLAETTLYLDRTLGNIKGNLIGYGLSAIQMKDLYDGSIVAKNDDGSLPRVGIIRVPTLLKGHTGLSLDMINPQIIDTVAPYNYKGEGCLSFPGLFHSTRRYRMVKLGFVDAQTLMPRELKLFGLEAVVAQHEIDHHDGVLFLDRANIPVKKIEQPKPNALCIVCLAEGKRTKWKKCLIHNV